MVLSELRKTPHLSASAIGEYVECSLLYRFGRIDKLPFEFRSDNLEFGTVIHRVLAEFYQARMTGDRMPLNDVHSLFEENWRAVAELNDEIRYSNGKDFQTLLMNGIDLLTAWYHKLPDDNFRVLSVEEAFSFNIPELSVPIIGAIDLMEMDDSGTVIIKPIAQRSIAWRLGIPYNYLRKCPPEIQSVQMNYWIEHEKNEQLFARFDRNSVRAIFTPKYKPVDNMDVILEIYGMGYRPETQVQCHLDEEFMSLSIMDGEKVFEINGDRFRPGVSISNSEVGLASLSVSAFILRLICTNGLVSKTELSASYRHVSTKILNEFPEILDKVSVELGKQRHQIGLSMESPVDDPMKTIESFNRQFGLNEDERKAVEWAWPQEAGETMFAVVNSYTRAAQFSGLSAESSYKLQRVGGNVLGMLN